MTMQLPKALRSRDAAAVACLIAGGFAYYSQFYDYGFNTGDEGALVLITMRILEGEVPYLDLQLGYGLLWYYPLALLFELTGVSFLVARIYLLSLAVVCALFAYWTVRRRTGIRALAVNVGLLVLALPGDLQNVYIPLVVLANMLAIGSIDLDRPALAGRSVVTAAAVVGVSAFIRAELALGAACILMTTLSVHTALRHPRGGRPRRLIRSFGLAAAGMLLPALPLLLFAYVQGFLQPLFWHMSWPFRVLGHMHLLTRKVQTPVGRIGADTISSEAGVQAATAGDAGATLARLPPATILDGGPAGTLAALTYLPLVSLALIGLFACWRMLRQCRRGGSPVTNDAFGVLALTGLAATAFPQFFLFRPDPAHMSFFMPGFFVLAAVCAGRWLLAAGSDRDRPAAPLARRLPALALSALLAIHVGLYFWFGVSTPTTGSMVALARGRTERFLGKNGVEVAVTPVERYLFDKVTRVVEAHSDEDDALLCLPFGPGWNVLTDRRTFGYAVYADDSLASSPWQQRTIDAIERERPPVIIVDNWPINGTEISRFKNWATRVMDHVAAEYELLDGVGSLEIYGRKRPQGDTT